MTTTEDNLEIELELENGATACLTNENRVIEVAMASVDHEIADDDPKSLAEAMARPDWLARIGRNGSWQWMKS